jgi:hypothetical protein
MGKALIKKGIGERGIRKIPKNAEDGTGGEAGSRGRDGKRES